MWGTALGTFVLGYKDAFKQIQVHAAEHKYLAGSAMGGFFHYLCIVFGIKSGPLVWGRVAALLMRLTAAATLGETLSLECFVDDPLFATGGDEHEQMSCFVLLSFSSEKFEVR